RYRKRLVCVALLAIDLISRVTENLISRVTEKRMAHTPACTRPLQERRSGIRRESALEELGRAETGAPRSTGSSKQDSLFRLARSRPKPGYGLISQMPRP